MKKSEVNRFNKLYKHHQQSLKLQSKAKKNIDAYSRAVRRVRDYFDCCPDKLLFRAIGSIVCRSC